VRTTSLAPVVSAGHNAFPEGRQEVAMVTLSGVYAVTGAGSGIGAGAARALRAAGADVVVMDRDRAGAEAVATEVGGTAVVLDVADPAAVAEAFEAPALRGLVHCAGNSLLAPILDCSIDEWHAVTSVQLDGTFLCLQAAARNMVRSGNGGTIVTVSSVNATFGHRGLAAYSAAKAGITMLTRVAALELAGAGIRVNSVAPGAVRTGMTREAFADPAVADVWGAATTAGRLAEPADIADVMVFLSSDASRWVNGQTLAVDAGTSLRVEPRLFPEELWSAPALRDQVDGRWAGKAPAGS
jgi:NAD(P)-dependent dehydrogenase (short-subunit alcohol dehydrogenase family)